MDRPSRDDLELVELALESLRAGDHEESATLFARLHLSSQADPTALRRAIIERSRSRRIAHREIVRVLARSKRLAAPPGQSHDIPPEWRACVEIGYITPTDNILSILDHGILCHNSAKPVSPRSVADLDVQNRRAHRSLKLPDGRSVPLHGYANLYLNPRNAMMYRVRSNDVAVLLVDAQRAFVFPGARLAPKNAAVGALETYALPSGLSHVDRDVVFSESWTTGGRDEGRMQAMQAEVLIPDRVPPDLITHVAVRTASQHERLVGQGSRVEVVMKPNLFFD